MSIDMLKMQTWILLILLLIFDSCFGTFKPYSFLMPFLGHILVLHFCFSFSRFGQLAQNTLLVLLGHLAPWLEAGGLGGRPQRAVGRRWPAPPGHGWWASIHAARIILREPEEVPRGAGRSARAGPSPGKYKT